LSIGPNDDWKKDVAALLEGHDKTSGHIVELAIDVV
jgi:hypothetical protein